MANENNQARLAEIDTMNRGQLETAIYKHIVKAGCDEDSAEFFLDSFASLDSLKAYLHACLSED